MTKQFSEMLTSPLLKPSTKRYVLQCLTLASLATKFILPPGGHLIEDNELRAIDESEPLKLPFRSVALEYHVPPTNDGLLASTKRIILAVEIENGIIVYCVSWIDEFKFFQPYPPIMLDNSNYLRRKDGNGGTPIIAFTSLDALNGGDGSSEAEMADCNYEGRVLLGFINALACSNVGIQRSDPKSAGKKVKSALPFDTYHVLTIDMPSSQCGGSATGGHRSPREHLRRGHIRRLGDGRRIWVNAAVVAAGRGAGVVTKDYALRRAA
jgi:hypothetical protein